MNIAIMQPYLLPYIGYFQLINSVDTFVIYDDVNYIKGGWINRNYVLSNNGKTLFTLPLSSSSPNKKINEIAILRNHKILKIIEYNYKNSPCFKEVYPLVEKIINEKNNNLALFLKNQIELICNYLNIKTRIILSSTIEKNISLRGEEQLISICKKLGAKNYINSPGGTVLYNRENFKNSGISLKFIETGAICYPQNGKHFEKNLSIVDILMFNDKKTCREILKKYELR